MNLTLLSPENSILSQTSSDVDLKDLKTRKHDELIDSMFKFARGEQGDADKKILVGLSAVQVGHLLRIILIDLDADGKGKTGNLQEFINPEVKPLSKETNDWYEACFSAGNIAGIVTRPNKVVVEALKRDGKPVRMELTGYTARIAQHEYDHTEGRRFPDLIVDSNNLHIVEPGQWPKYRNQGAWRNWSTKATFEQWNEIKGIDKP